MKSLLIANRGEIACRIIRTARRLGIRTVTVHSVADAGARHVREADETVFIGASPARESYLDGKRIIAAALATGAEAIHPGYGFLSENAGFAQGVADAGLIWVGPRPESIRAMGLKDAAKARMIAAGVPVTPGYLGEDQSPERLRREADAIGYPVLIKAVAGGGGKGMRRVDAADAFAGALESCRREAASSFGDDRVLIEKYILSPRHIEVQVFGDTHGNVVHLFERDCSLQRRHQKVIEEAPAPGMDAATREAVCAAAVRAARSVDYVGAGTIEFIADASASASAGDGAGDGSGLRADRIWFMEMNTRLQVEHPVTEEITGVDLVEWQLRIAAGEPIPLAQDALSIRGWAIEARLYAEDPARGFLPSPGGIDHLRFDDRIRIETGVAEGDVVSTFYDPMIAKLVAHGKTREAARTLLRSALDQTQIAPLQSNAGFLHACLGNPDFVAGTVDTGLIEREGEALFPPAEPSPAALDAAARLAAEDAGRDAGVRVPGFRLNRAPRDTVDFHVGGRHMVGSSRAAGAAHVATMTAGGDIAVTEAGTTWLLRSRPPAGGGDGAEGDGAIVAPMPGRIIAIHVAAGDTVARGQTLVTLEAMKMEHGLTAPFAGSVAALDLEVGAQVAEGFVLVRVAGAGD